MLKLYHGTNTTFDKIELNKCLPYKDFGRGFYLTSIRQQAMGRACDKCAFEGGTPAILTMKKAEFEFIVCSIVDEMVGFLMEDYNMSILEAFNKIYTSKIYEKLQDKETRLYLRSAAYTYEHLKKEL